MNKNVQRSLAGVVAAAALLFAGHAVATDTYIVYGYGDTEAASRSDAIFAGRTACQNNGYANADVEIVYSYFAGGYVTYAIATCF